MTFDDVLERGLAASAADYDVPAGGVDRLRAQLAPAAEPPAPRRAGIRRFAPTGPRAVLAGLAACLALLIGLPLALGGSGSNGGGGESASSAGGSNAAGLPPVAGGADFGANSEKTSRLDHRTAAGPAAAPDTQRESAPSAESSGSGGGLSLDQTVPAPIPASVNRVVKTGEIDLQVAKGAVTPTLQAVTALAAAERGYISDSQTDEAGSTPSGQVTLRVPVERFEDTVQRARSIAGAKVLSLQTSGVDVTSKYVDLQARIKALKATRATFLTILSKATTIGQTLAVQQQVTDVQTQIEQLQGQLKVLADSSSMSTLTVSVGQKSHPVTTQQVHRDNGLARAVKLSVSRFVRGVEAIVGVIGPIVLALLLVVLGWLAARFGYRVTRRHLV